ncbi:ubiquitin carboxyl-terminal hydrolase isozyme L3 [Gamsiella multidivaricata]|uniref:ubiquitin carboxyl-terminal hydrolase isozyme L3 n=1 Tax=Gamsiella multidivaricata TaxID=101098 RepID=UPI00221F5286|nr:ubiquitin carboxyl-terminal hydrolase isozyme L3 [Gamsiella multidivaricata]KAI7825984.1 ubiquitin carboxyl-terminal hydrolase isozyme L3 [Gamsiella multidivaricata]
MSTTTAEPTKKTIRWLPLESNPEVLDKYVRDLGVPAPWRYADVMGLDEELLAFVPQPVHALILLFPITPKYEEYRKEEQSRIDQQGQTVSPKVIFYPQTISNACGTMGVLHSIANNWAYGESLKLDEGSIIETFLKRTIEMSPAERAKALEEDKAWAHVHEGHASTGQTATPDLADDVDLHYVCLIERDGHLYELDGNKPYPINHGTTSKDTFLLDAIKVAKEFVKRDPDNLNFSVIAATTAEGEDY